MKFVSLLLISCLTLCTVGCAPVERQAYNTIVAAKAFLDAEKGQHSECRTDASIPVCAALARATAAKDTLIDAAEVYCSGPQFESGGACDAPAKGTPAYNQGVAKVKAAIAIYDQAAKDLKSLKGGN